MGWPIRNGPVNIILCSHLSIDEKSYIINIGKASLKNLCKYKGIEIIEGHMMPDHVHLLLSIPPKYSVLQIMRYLKGKSALIMFDKHANLKYKFGNRHFWAEGYYVSTVGLNEATIKNIFKNKKSTILPWIS